MNIDKGYLNKAERALQIDEYQKAIAKHVRQNEVLKAKLQLAEDALEAAQFHFALVKSNTACIGKSLCHVDGNCVHCLVATSEYRVRAALDRGTSKMNNHKAVISGVIPAHTRQEKDALIAHLKAKLKLAEKRLEEIQIGGMGSYSGIACASTALAVLEELRKG